MPGKDPGQIIDGIPKRDREIGGEHVEDGVLGTVGGAGTARDRPELRRERIAEPLRQWLKERCPALRTRGARRRGGTCGGEKRVGTPGRQERRLVDRRQLVARGA